MTLQIKRRPVSTPLGPRHRLELPSNLTLFLLNKEAVLFSGRNRNLYGLDEFATGLLLSLADGATVEHLASRFNLDAPTVAAVEKLSALLTGEDPPPGDYRVETFCAEEAPAVSEGLPAYSLLSTFFKIKCYDENLMQLLADVFCHLRVTGRPDKIHLVVDIQPEGDLWRLTLNNTPQAAPLPREKLLPLIYDRLRKIAYQKLSFLLTFHAAAVTNGRHTIMLPGRSGSGKSTLAASLLARGYSLFSDETAVLDRDGRLVPVPLGLGLKSGSWDVLASEFPELRTLPEHLRWDGLPVRYLQQERIPFAADSANGSVTHICLPKYTRVGTAKIKYLGPVHALRALTDNGYQVRDLTADTVEKIIDWLLGLTCFELTYSSTEEALTGLEAGLREPVPARRVCA